MSYRDKYKLIKQQKLIVDKSVSSLILAFVCLGMTTGLVLLPVESFADEVREESCFPVGRARHDRECYDFDQKDNCLKRDDIFSCAWGLRQENPISDDEMLVCDSARCEELPDDHDLYGN